MYTIFLESLADYETMNETLMFSICEIQQCVNVTIVNDLEEESDEIFSCTLERTPGLHSNIDLDPDVGNIMIVSNDGKLTINILSCFLYDHQIEFGQCYTGSHCTGDPIPAVSSRDCCVGTNIGLSFSSSSSCIQCVGGFINGCMHWL